MGTSAVQLDPNEMRNLAISLGNNVPPGIAAPVNMPAPQPQTADLGIPTTQPHVIAPRGTIAGDTAERSRELSTGSGIDQIYGKVTGSQFGQQHPTMAKILGGLGEGIAKAGDIGLSAVAPALAINLPGTEYHHMAQLHQLNRQIGDEAAEGEKQAQTQEAQGRVPLEAAQTHEATARAESLENPPEKPDKYSYQQTDHGLMRIDNTTGEASPVMYNGQPLQPKKEPVKGVQSDVEVGGKPHSELVNPETGEVIKDLGPKGEKPVQAPGITMIVPDPNNPGGGRVERVAAGGTVAPGAQTAAGFNAVNTPTMQQRTAAGRAQTVVAMAPEVLSRIDSVAGKLGPVEGRWNEFMQGKVGMENPEFAALRSDLLMMSSAVALAHAQGRLPENLREEFDNAINAPKQTPENLKATINTMLPWLTAMQNQGHPNAQAQGNEPPRPASVPEGYTFNANGPKGAGWYAPTKPATK